MKIFVPMLFLCAVATASRLSGKVVMPDGVPIAGAVVRASDQTDVTAAGGSWSIERFVPEGGDAFSPRARSGRVRIENGRLRWDRGGYSADGRAGIVAAAGDVASPMDVAVRTASGSFDTLSVYWNGKRLALLPLTESDSTDVVIKVDTSWNDDFGMPWNPRVEYGTLRDGRDGKVYRTIFVGNREWMAENLALWAASIPECIEAGQECTKYGLLFPAGGKLIGQQADSACPEGWRVPTIDHWRDLAAAFGRSLGDRGGSIGGFARVLKARSGWRKGNGSDLAGFRAIPQYWDRSYFAVATGTGGDLAIQVDGGGEEVAIHEVREDDEVGRHHNIRCVRD